MRPSQDILSILRLTGLIMVCCRSLATMAALTPRWVKISFCTYTVRIRTSSWRGAVASNILGDAVLAINVPRRDVSSMGL